MLRIAHRLAIAALSDDRRPDIPPNINAHSILCDNVEEYLASDAGPSALNVGVLAGTVPPWPSAVYEWKSLHKMFPSEIQQVGGMCVAVDVSASSEAAALCKQNIADFADRFDGFDVGDIRWDVGIYPYFVARGCLSRPLPMVWAVLGNTGLILDQILFDNEEINEGVKTLATYTAYVIHVANSMLNCKNVSTVDSTATDAPPAKWQRRMKTPEIRYSRIKIDGFTSEAKTQGGGIDGHNKAWHICRGNFATYTDKAPLFGKYTGRYWRPQHVKGDKKHGEVHSTHEIAKPRT